MGCRVGHEASVVLGSCKGKALRFKNGFRALILDHEKPNQCELKGWIHPRILSWKIVK